VVIALRHLAFVLFVSQKRSCFVFCFRKRLSKQKWVLLSVRCSTSEGNARSHDSDNAKAEALTKFWQNQQDLDRSETKKERSKITHIHKMMEEDLEERLLGGHAVSAVAGDDSRGLHRYNTEQRNGFSSPAPGPQLRDLRKRKPSPDSGNRRRTTSSGSSDEAMVQSPRGSEATSPAPNPFDDDTPPSIEQPAAQHSHSNGVQDANASRRVESPAARSINEPRTKEEQKSEKKKDNVEQVAAEIAAEDANVEVEEGKQERADSRKHDEDALARVHLRMERLWKLEEDHARLNYRYARLEEAKKKTEGVPCPLFSSNDSRGWGTYALSFHGLQERNEWQSKHARQVEENEKMVRFLL
jgi:hypothetical protein